MSRTHAQSRWPRPIRQRFPRVGIGVAALLFSTLVAGCGDDDSGRTAQAPLARDPQLLYARDGRSLILHGANVASSAKSHPLRVPEISEAEVLRLSRDFGFNFARYLILWDGLEPNKGQIDSAYLDRIGERLDWFARAHMLVMLDMHQDVYAARFCCDGAPEWAIRDDGLPFSLQPQWFLNYFQPAVRRAFDNFWNYDGPHADLQDHYFAAWAAVVQRFKNHPAVLGYDVMNEPHPGTMFDAAEAVGLPPLANSKSPVFDRTRLQPFYQRAIERIRQVDNDGWIFFEPRYGAPGNGSPSFLGILDDPREGDSRLAMAPHLYSVKLEASLRYEPASDPVLENWETRRAAESSAQQAPLLIGEWGLDPQWSNAALFTERAVALADRMRAGWAYWSYDPGGWSFLHADLSERPNLNILVRPYPQHTAGIVKSYSFDASTRVFTMTLIPDPTISLPTEIYIPAQRFYAEGWVVECSAPAGQWRQSWDAQREILSLWLHTPANEYSIVVRPRGPLR